MLNSASPHYKHRYQYYQQRWRAMERGIAWKLTYVQWRMIWAKSGHWNKRGRKRGDYCMSRLGDKGSYSPDNVRIILFTQNVQEGHLGKKRSIITCRKIAKAMLGKKHGLGNKSRSGLVGTRGMTGKRHSPASRKKMSEAKLGNKNMLGKKHTLETRQKMSETRLGKKHTSETRYKISAARKAWWCKQRSV